MKHSEMSREAQEIREMYYRLTPCGFDPSEVLQEWAIKAWESMASWHRAEVARAVKDAVSERTRQVAEIMRREYFVEGAFGLRPWPRDLRVYQEILFLDKPEPRWCEHISWSSNNLWTVNAKEHGYSDVPKTWTCCPVCRAPRPDAAKGEDGK